MRSPCATVVLAVALLAAATAASAAPAPSGRVCKAGEIRWLERWDRAYAGRIKAPTTVFRRPGADPFLRLQTVDRYRFWTTVPIVAERLDRRCRPTWFRVRVRHFPNGTLGWVRAGTMTTSRIRSHRRRPLAAPAVLLQARPARAQLAGGHREAEHPDSGRGGSSSRSAG